MRNFHWVAEWFAVQDEWLRIAVNHGVPVARRCPMRGGH